MQKLTDTDIQIIEALRIDARQSNKGMALKMGVSEETVRRRIHAMVKSGVLQFDVNVSAEALGMPVSALIAVTFGSDGAISNNLLETRPNIYVQCVHNTLDGGQIYQIAAKTLADPRAATIALKANPQVVDATITLLFPNGDHRI